MYVGFRSFLGALVVLGLSLGASYGLGVATAENSAPAVAANSAAGAGAAGSAAAAASGAGAAAGGGGAGFLGGGGQTVAGTVESATPTSLVVKTADGTMVTLALTAQTVIRKTDTGTAQDLKAGTQVLATREGTTNAATVSIVSAGTTLPGAGGGGPRSGGGGAGSTTPRATATP